MYLSLNEIKQSTDPTIIPVTFSIIDYDLSQNNVMVTRDVALEGSKTLLNKPIVAAYNEVDEPNTKTDNFGSHEEYLGENKYGNQIVKRNTVPIGVFTSEGYETTIDVNGESKTVIAADAVLWKTRFPDACDLILEWYENDIEIHTSCEYLYSNHSFQDGIEYHHSPIYFEGQAVLASEDRGAKSEVLPAYESAKLISMNEMTKFNRLVAQALNQKNESEEVIEMEDKELKLQFNEISIDSARYKIRELIKASISEAEYVWVREMFSTYVIVSVEDEDFSNEKQYKFAYSIEGNDVTVDLESKEEVQEITEWVSVEKEVVTLNHQINKLTDEKSGLELQVTNFETSLNDVKVEKEDITVKFNDASETIIQLNSTIDTLKPFKDQFEKEEYDRVLNEKKDFYLSKFNAVGAVEKFETEEVQNLITTSILDGDESKDAILQLNSLLVDLVEVKIDNPEVPALRSLSSKREHLLPSEDDFTSKFIIK